MSKYLELRADENGYEYVHRIKGSAVVAVIAFDLDDNILLVKQYRPPIGAHVIDIPAGLVGDIEGIEEEALKEAAKRELMEETGHADDSDTLSLRFELPTSPGLTDEAINYFSAYHCTHKDVRKTYEDGKIELIKVPARKLDEYIKTSLRAGFVIDPKVFVANWWILE